ELDQAADLPAAAAQRQNKTASPCLVRRDNVAVRQYHIGGQQVVDRQAVFTGEIADAAAKGQPAHASGRDEPGRHRQPEGVCGVVDIAPQRPAFDAHGALCGVDVDTAHVREVDHHAIVAGTEPSAVVPAPGNSGQQIVGPRIVDGGDHIRHVDTSHDERGSLVDHPVVEQSDGLVRFAIRLNDGAANPGT